jgi:hypothetical protein
VLHELQDTAAAAASGHALEGNVENTVEQQPGAQADGGDTKDGEDAAPHRYGAIKGGLSDGDFERMESMVGSAEGGVGGVLTDDDLRVLGEFALMTHGGSDGEIPMFENRDEDHTGLHFLEGDMVAHEDDLPQVQAHLPDTVPQQGEASAQPKATVAPPAAAVPASAPAAAATTAPAASPAAAAPVPVPETAAPSPETDEDAAAPVTATSEDDDA